MTPNIINNLVSDNTWHSDAAGEVTLTGKVLPIGGVKEKTLAARRSGVKHLIFPEGNRRDWDELTEASGFEIGTGVAWYCYNCHL